MYRNIKTKFFIFISQLDSSKPNSNRISNGWWLWHRWYYCDAGDFDVDVDVDSEPAFDSASAQKRTDRL